ncbi:Caenorhabditis elegans ly-6-related family-containing protein [Strongyloides ratti]|uniref:Caenorhabditis elegans ly-6-related family-containing protein n=1 Tax=Strongyloides ratti TaxID=34506 RepID=A0A090LHG1_STRRB|nr:Caenorhabditis elegans ly-6-related family-containing protein [Strongyloides ratti]CEF69201.1 Caenorhabditis elegans ly-6-related family-containing protein [Strongyloides ratti]
MYFVFFNFFIFHLLFSIYGLWIEDGKERRSWKDQHPQHRYVAQIHAEHYRYPTFRMQCYSCMSPYLEDQFLYISHLYRKPLQFSERCDEARFYGDGMKVKNCSDMCVTLRMNDKVGGRRRHGYMRGCLSDILHYNRTVVRENPNCYHVRLRDLFVSSDRYSFEPTDNVMLCTCSNKLLCNTGSSIYSRIFFLSLNEEYLVEQIYLPSFIGALIWLAL